MFNFGKRLGLDLTDSLQNVLANVRIATSVVGPYSSLAEQLRVDDFRGHQIFQPSFFRDQDVSGASAVKSIQLASQMITRSTSPFLDLSWALSRMDDTMPLVKSVSAMVAQLHLRSPGIDLSWTRRLDTSALAAISDRSPSGLGAFLKETTVHSRVAVAFLSPVVVPGASFELSAVRLLGTSFPTIDHIALKAPTREDIAILVDGVLGALDGLAARATSEPSADSGTADNSDSSEIQDPAGPPEQRPPRIWTAGPREVEGTDRHITLAPIHVLLGASYKDTEHREALVSHLTALLATNTITLWSEADTRPGDDCDAALNHNLQLAQLVLLLLSADYLRELHTKGKLQAFRAAARRAVIVPVFVRAVDTSGLWLADLSPLPADGTAVASSRDTDDTWYRIATSIRERVEGIRAAGRRLHH